MDASHTNGLTAELNSYCKAAPVLYDTCSKPPPQVTWRKHRTIRTSLLF